MHQLAEGPQKMTTLLDRIFEVFVEEGRELGPRELKNSHPGLVNAVMRKYPAASLAQILKKLSRAYSSRWEEINPKPKASLTILEKMKLAERKI